MSDLQCPTRLLVARHGAAEYESVELHDNGGSLTAEGRRQSDALGERLASERVAAVWCSAMSRAVQTAEIAAARLGVSVTVREGLREFGVGGFAGRPPEPDPFIATCSAWLEGDLDQRIEGGESGREVVDRVREVLDEIADSHRGEAVLVVSHGGAICTAVSALTGHGPPTDFRLPNAGVVRLERDGDGFRLARPWDTAAG